MVIGHELSQCEPYRSVSQFVCFLSLQRLAVELELPSAAARRRSRERSRSNSGELGAPMGCDDATARWAAYAAAGAQGHAVSGQCGLQAASGGQPSDSLR